jgi:hypothetical protein
MNFVLKFSRSIYFVWLSTRYYQTTCHRSFWIHRNAHPHHQALIVPGSLPIIWVPRWRDPKVVWRLDSRGYSSLAPRNLYASTAESDREVFPILIPNRLGLSSSTSSSETASFLKLLLHKFFSSPLHPLCCFLYWSVFELDRTLFFLLKLVANVIGFS